MGERPIWYEEIEAWTADWSGYGDKNKPQKVFYTELFNELIASWLERYEQGRDVLVACQDAESRRRFVLRALRNKQIDHFRGEKSRSGRDETFDERQVSGELDEEKPRGVGESLDEGSYRALLCRIYREVRWEKTSREQTDMCCFFLYHTRLKMLRRACEHDRGGHFEWSELVGLIEQLFSLSDADLALVLRVGWPELGPLWSRTLGWMDEELGRRPAQDAELCGWFGPEGIELISMANWQKLAERSRDRLYAECEGRGIQVSEALRSWLGAS